MKQTKIAWKYKSFARDKQVAWKGKQGWERKEWDTGRAENFMAERQTGRNKGKENQQLDKCQRRCHGQVQQKTKLAQQLQQQEKWKRQKLKAGAD